MSRSLARAILEELPPEWLDPNELADFDANAAVWGAPVAEEESSREGVNGFGFDSVTPEATELALMVARVAMEVVIESGLHAWWKHLRSRPKQPAPLSPAQLLELRSRMVARISEIGADEDTAEVYADAAIAALQQGGDNEEAA